jgi:hypothetical protein
MDHNSKRVADRKHQILANLAKSIKGVAVGRSEEISLEQFQEELTKGVKFFSPSDIERFNKSVKVQTIGASSELEKSRLMKSADDQLASLKRVTVITSTGRPVDFYKAVSAEEIKKGEEEEEEEDPKKEKEEEEISE